MTSMKWILNIFVFLFSLSSIFANADTIKVGTTQSLTGIYDSFGTAQLRGLTMWKDDLNARGALLGKKVELIVYDDQSSAELSVALYSKLINEDKVDLLIGPYSSELTLAASAFTETYKIPMVATAASAEKIWQRGYHYIFGIDVPSAHYMQLAIDVAEHFNIQKYALVYAETEFTIDAAEGVRAGLQKPGHQIVYEQSYSLEQTNFDEIAKGIADSGAEMLIASSYLNDSTALSQSLVRQKTPLAMIAFAVGSTVQDYADTMGKSAEGIIGAVQWIPSVRLPMARDFAFRFSMKHGEDPGVHDAIGYSAGQVVEAAVRLAGSTNPDAVRDQLQTMKFRSLFGHYAVDENGRQTGKENYLLQWQDGERRLVAPSYLAERKIIFPLERNH